MEFKNIKEGCVDPVTGMEINLNKPYHECSKCGAMYQGSSFEALGGTCATCGHGITFNKDVALWRSMVELEDIPNNGQILMSVCDCVYDEAAWPVLKVTLVDGVVQDIEVLHESQFGIYQNNFVKVGDTVGDLMTLLLYEDVLHHPHTEFRAVLNDIDRWEAPTLEDVKDDIPF